MEFFQCVTNIITNTNRMILKETLNMYETPQFARAPSTLVDTGKSLELPYWVGIVGKVGNELGRTQWNPIPSLLDKLDVKLI